MYYVSTNTQYRVVNLYVYLVSLVYRDIKRPIYVFRILQLRDPPMALCSKNVDANTVGHCVWPKRIPLWIERELQDLSTTGDWYRFKLEVSRKYKHERMCFL